MNPLEYIAAAASRCVAALYGTEPAPGLIQVQPTRKEFEGDVTLVVFPLLKPVTATLVIFNTMWIWNDFLLTYLFLSSTKKATLIMQVYNGVGQFSNDWSIMMPALVLALLPMVIFYLVMQKHIIGGLTSGAVKG